MHIIRLRHPWQAAWHDQPTGDAPPLNHTLLSHTAQQRCVAHYSRQFHRPSGLNERQVVTLILQATGSASLTLQSNDSQRQRTPAAQAKSEAACTEPANCDPNCIVEIHSILLNSQPLTFSVLTSHDNNITHISTRIDSKLEPFNQLEIVCGVATVQSIDTSSPPPPAISQWAEVLLEIDD